MSLASQTAQFGEPGVCVRAREITAYTETRVVSSNDYCVIGRELARIAATKPKPSHWYATVTRKANEEGHEDHFIAVTLKWVRETVLSIQEVAVRVAQKLGTEVTKFIYKQAWRGINIERWADTAVEVGTHKGKYFAWLCQREMCSRICA
jgi:hypothetical protein